MNKILIDTCVWLDLAKDQKQQILLNAMEELIRQNELNIIVPRTVLDEFGRNKIKIIKESSQSLIGVFTRVKEVVDKFGDTRSKDLVLEQLNNIGNKIPSLGESTTTSISRIEKLLKSGSIIETLDEIKLRAVQRAIERKAPFHNQRNNINDAIIIETYAHCVRKDSAGIKFSFVTHNKHDFSLPNGNERIPHPDFAHYFSKIKSRYFIKLSQAIQRINPALVNEIMIEEEWIEEPRSLTEILAAEEEFFERIWYDRKLVFLANINDGLEKEPLTEIKKGMLAAMKRIEDKYGGKKALRNYYKDDFSWGMLNGKLSALRWVLGSDWDMLDT